MARLEDRPPKRIARSSTLEDLRASIAAAPPGNVSAGSVDWAAAFGCGAASATRATSDTPVRCGLIASPGSRMVSPSGAARLEGVHKAAYLGDLQGLKRIVSDDPRALSLPSKDGWLPLHYACEHGHLACVEYLVSLKANVDCRGRDGWTPLMWAARRGHLDVASYLLDLGADPTLVHIKGW